MSLSHILGIIANHQHIAYLLIFLISLSESLALVGLLVPGTSQVVVKGKALLAMETIS